MTEELKPCPFCETAEYVHIEEIEFYYRGHCHKCGALGPGFVNRAEAVQAWNARPGEDALSADLRGALAETREARILREAARTRANDLLDMLDDIHGLIRLVMGADFVLGDYLDTCQHIGAMIEKLERRATAAEAVLAFHPRAAKLMRKRKNFVVIAEDEPYFIDAYLTIRANEQKAGRWTNEDEERYQIALANSLG